MDNQENSDGDLRLLLSDTRQPSEAREAVVPISLKNFRTVTAGLRAALDTFRGLDLVGSRVGLTTEALILAEDALEALTPDLAGGYVPAPTLPDLLDYADVAGGYPEDTVNDAALGRALIRFRHEIRALTDPRQPSEGWRPIENAPRDGTEFIATVRVFSNSAFSHHDMHIVAVDDETGELANHYEQGWRLEDYEFWRPLPAPPTGGGGGL